MTVLHYYKLQIRAKEADKLQRDMTRSESDSKELEMLSRLPDLARILRVYP